MAINYLFGSAATVTISNGDHTFLMPDSSIRAGSDGVHLLSPGTFVTTFHNLGTVLAGSDGVEVFSAYSRIVNFGVINSIFNGIRINSSDAFASHRIVNYGSITALLPITTAASAAYDLSVTNSGSLVSINDAHILLDNANLGNIEVVNSGYMKGGELGMSATGLATLINTGSIITTLIDADSGSSARISNSGEIVDALGDAGGLVLRTGDSGDTVTNSGSIIGSVDLNAGADLYRGMGSGFVTLGVDGDVGNDTLIGAAGKDHFDGGGNNDLLVGHGDDDTLLGDAGFDTLLGGEGNDSLDGGNNADTMNGNAGSDTLRGGFGNDLLVGQEGDDLLDGGPGNDIMDGGSGDDVLEGGTSNDILRGRAGEDDLAGGEGLDLLTGGQGADNFVFRSVADAGLGATRDQILDFEQGSDLIIVAGLHPGVFEFRGTAGFAPSGNPELRLFETPTGSTIVQMDADGNGSVDAEIRVAAVIGLTEADFVL
ncbi:calcium-binding protein [Maliponia aquimaris]|uniref:Poly(Beta-D-mannuronate) C5 epimerase 7 n=1 Tax=Maliponia aquimaris TaxID=1673631 RepID=A0A238JP05_9RHOB|nr:calcium-binding protein [Maliponia aquimaris]SMX32381.1 Poly(beta-D-mannuronate) C5 epimerase 7 [Maliponia aquimaris]